MPGRQFCVHGHFYQPPREDPITGDIPIEPGAAPYRNWNERIHDQCYRPNAMLGNFEHISFNIGPTLANWMAGYDPATLQSIIQQERRNLEYYGVGNGMAQPYNHTILPLATREDKVTQVCWGIANFEHYFGHKPVGMWLPETAVDEETLEVMVECGIQFTILAPWQTRIKHLDINQPHWVSLPGGKQITVFFYDQDLSTRISFDPGATINADNFVLETLLPKYQKDGYSANETQLIMIASDGELYGHHQPFRDQFLSYLTEGALHGRSINRTYPGRWMKENITKNKITIRPETSWSCSHGIQRWKGVCGCTPHGEWKAPFRQALDKLAQKLDEQYLSTLRHYLDDPMLLRHRYIDVIQNKLTLAALITELTGDRLDEAAISKARMLLDAQYERQRMFTSCGWFFDDFDRIEPKNNIAYAAQAVWLTYMATGIDLQSKVQEWLRPVKSWRTGLTAREVFDLCLRRSREKYR
jgi:hypothetical protein